MTKIHKNWITLIIFFLFVGALYWWYELEFYTYLCERESNAPACYVLNDQYKKRGYETRGLRYLELSCDMKYERACKKLSRGTDKQEKGKNVK